MRKRKSKRKKQPSKHCKTGKEVKQQRDSNYLFLLAVLVIAVSSFFLLTESPAILPEDSDTSIENRISERIILEIGENPQASGRILINNEKLQQFSKKSYKNIKQSLGVDRNSEVVIFIEDDLGNIVPINIESKTRCIGNPNSKVIILDC